MDHSHQLNQLTCQAAWALAQEGKNLSIIILSQLKKRCPELSFAIWRRGPALAFATLYQSCNKSEVRLLLDAIAEFVLIERLQLDRSEATIEKLITHSNTADFFKMGFIQEETLLFVEQVEKYAAGLIGEESRSAAEEQPQKE